MARHVRKSRKKTSRAGGTRVPALTVVQIENLRDFMNEIEQRIGDQSEALWYRGVGSAARSLQPGLYRHPSISEPAKLLELEKSMIVRFKQRSVPYQTRPLNSSWDYLFFMQHFGLPTRLLDWTENPYIGLYFALTDAGRYEVNGTRIYSEDAAVWILRPSSWNRKALEHIGSQGEILSPGDDASLSGYEPLSTSGVLGVQPVAIHGTHNSYRIVAQRGVFMIFGRSTAPMEQSYQTLRFGQDTLVKLEIPARRIQTILKSLTAIGITDSVVFPDLDGLAKETKRYFEFPV